MKRRWNGYRRRMLPLVLTLGLLLTGCGSSASGTGTETEQATGEASHVFRPEVVNLAAGVKQEEQEYKAVSAEHGSALSTGAVQLLLTTMEQEGKPNQNYLISPVSLQMACGMLAAGTEAGSETGKELMELLMPGTGATPAELNQEMASLAKRMRTSIGVDWNVVNSLWIKKDGDVTLTEEYLSDAVNYYQAELYAAPFDTTTVDEINAWVKQNTKDRIPKILEYLDEKTVLVLVNALAFDGEWEIPIGTNKVKENADFTNADGTKSKATMLQSEEQGYVTLSGGQGFLRPYKGGSYAFLGLLPPEGMTAEEYLKQILASDTAISEAIRSRDYAPILEVEFPEFRAEYGATMNDTLKALGVKKAFLPEAEFGRMITPESQRISVDQVTHMSMIEVDRTGTKAAAATAIAATEAAVMEQPEVIKITLDRPFIYAIIDMYTGIPVFLGVQNTMK